MSGDSKPVSVQILDKEYVVACAEDERESLYAAVEFLNARMRELRDGGKVIGSERVAVMTALNIAHEYLEYRRRTEAYSSTVGQTIERIQSKLAGALSRGHQLELTEARPSATH